MYTAGRESRHSSRDGANKQGITPKRQSGRRNKYGWSVSVWGLCLAYCGFLTDINLRGCKQLLRAGSATSSRQVIQDMRSSPTSAFGCKCELLVVANPYSQRRFSLRTTRSPDCEPATTTPTLAGRGLGRGTANPLSPSRPILRPFREGKTECRTIAAR